MSADVVIFQNGDPADMADAPDINRSLRYVLALGRVPQPVEEPTVFDIIRERMPPDAMSCVVVCRDGGHGVYHTQFKPDTPTAQRLAIRRAFEGLAAKGCRCWEPVASRYGVDVP